MCVCVFVCVCVLRDRFDKPNYKTERSCWRFISCHCLGKQRDTLSLLVAMSK